MTVSYDPIFFAPSNSWLLHRGEKLARIARRFLVRLPKKHVPDVLHDAHARARYSLVQDFSILPRYEPVVVAMQNQRGRFDFAEAIESVERLNILTARNRHHLPHECVRRRARVRTTLFD